MDLLYALDDSFQNGTADANSIAPIARLLGADTVMVVNSYQYERFGVQRPERSASLIASAPGLTPIGDFGEPSINLAEDYETNDLQDFPPTALPEISVYEVSDATPGARITNNPIVVSADGSGMVDLAVAGLIDGKSSILASGALDETSLQQAVLNAPEVIVTDSNRKRAHQWRGSQEVWGATEGVGPVVDSFDAFDNRLPVFPLATDRLEAYSISENYSGSVMSATAYGALLSYLPEYRPSNANDGNINTSWSIGWGINPIGQILTYASNLGHPKVEHLELVPAQLSFEQRLITKISVSLEGSPWTTHAIDLSASVTRIELDQPAQSVRIRIDEVTEGDNQLPVGWAEVLPAAFQRSEEITVPSDATMLVKPTTPVSFVFTRLRADPYDPRRQDPEMSINRNFFVTNRGSFTISAQATSTGEVEVSSSCRDDLLTIDYLKILTKVTQVQGPTVTIESCEVFTSGRGLRNIQTPTDSPIIINQLILRSTRAKEASLSITIPTSDTRSQRTTSINSCTSGCWLELADGWNIGWKASLSGETLADPVASAGGRLLWNLPATPDNTRFETTWTPQMRMWIGIAITLLGLIASVVILVVPRLRRRPLQPEQSPIRRPITINSRVEAVTYAAVLAALVISPVYGLLAGVIAALAYGFRRTHTVGVALISLGMLFLIAQQIRTGAEPSFGWPSVFRRAHRPVLLGVVLISLSSWMAPQPKPNEHADRTASVSPL
jgi:hypothetical protein